MNETKNKKKVSKGVKRARSMRNMIMMVLVCVLMLSAATYAWFTLSETARITNLTMTVGQETGLLIAPDTSVSTRTERNAAGTAGTYSGVLEFKTAGTEGDGYDISGVLLPGTLTANGTDVQAPDYNTNGEVSGLKNADAISDTTGATTTGHVYKTSFFMRTTDPANVSVKLKGATLNGDASTVPGDGGTYVLNASNATYGATAIRIKLSDGTNSIVYRPLDGYTNQNADMTAAADVRDVKTTVTPTDVQALDGSFGVTQGSLEITPTGNRIFMEIWLEGTDTYCVNEIMADQIIGQLEFEVVQPTP